MRAQTWVLIFAKLHKDAMQDFPANSRKATETEPREEIKPVTTAETRRRKHGLGRKFKNTFIAGTGRDALSYMVEDHIVPEIRDMLVNALQGGIERLFNGDRATRPRPGRSSWMNNNTGHVNYQGMSTSSVSSAPKSMSSKARARHAFDELIIPSKSEANDVLDRMYDILSRQGNVSVADLYALTGVRAEHTDMKWGWTSLHGSRAVHVNKLGGYLLDLPEPEELR
jgi:hypothetical protein